MNSSIIRVDRACAVNWQFS